MAHPLPGRSPGPLMLLVSSRGPGQFLLLCGILPQFFVTAPHTVQHQNLVPGVPVTADSAPPRPQLDLCPEVFLHPPKLFDLNSQMQPLEIKETG